jgi:hypothetical protein
MIGQNNGILGVIAQADLAREPHAVGRKDFGKVVQEISAPGR